MSSIENVARDRPVSGQEDTFSLLPDAGEGSGMRAATFVIGDQVTQPKSFGALTPNPSPAIGRGECLRLRCCV